MGHYPRNGGNAMPLPDTSETMPRPVPGEPMGNDPLSIPTEKMPFASSGETMGGEMISVDSPLPGRGQ